MSSSSSSNGGSDRNKNQRRGNNNAASLRGKQAALLSRIRSSGDDEEGEETNNNNNGNNANDTMRDSGNNNGPPPPAAAAGGASSAAATAGTPSTSNRSSSLSTRAYAPRASSNSGNNNRGQFAAFAGRAADNNNQRDMSLKRLIHRLKREHVSNVGNNSRPNKQRARYMLEACAGNVGLAARLYWEDYAVRAEDPHDNEDEDSSSNEDDNDYDDDNDGANTDDAVSGRKRPRDDNNASHRDALLSSSAAKKPATAGRKTTGLKNDSNGDSRRSSSNSSNGNDNNDPLNHQSRSALTSMRQFQLELGDKLSSLQERLSSSLPPTAADNNAPPPRDRNVEELLARAAALSSAASRNNGRRSSVDSTATVPGRPLPNMNMAQQQQQQQQQLQGGTGAGGNLAALYPDIMRLGLSEGELDRNALNAADAGLAAAAQVDWLGAGAMFGSTRGGGGEAFNAALAAALQGEQHVQRYLMPPHQQQAAAAAAGAGNPEQAAAAGAGGIWDQIVSRALANPGRQLESDEARAFLAALAADSSHGGRNSNAGVAAAAAAGAGGNGGDGSDGDDDDDNSSLGSTDARRGGRADRRDNADADDNNPEAPLRRSLRLRSARRRDAVRMALAMANRANRRVRMANRDGGINPGGGEDHNVSGSDDETFMPGPVPVFRKGATSSPTKSESTTPSKRKKMDDLVNSNLRLYGHSDDESDNAYDDDTVDIDDYLYGTEDYPDPSRVLWDSFPQHDADGDSLPEDSPQIIPISWLRSGFSLSQCGNGLAMHEPTDDEWDDIRRSLPQNIRDSTLKNVKALFPYNCKGVSAMLSLVTALLYSGVSLQKGAISINVDRKSFDELTLEERRKQFDVRLEDVLSSLIFVAAKAGAQRCSKKIADYDKFLARRRRTMDPEEQSYYLQRRQWLEKRTHLCNVCWWDVDSTTGATSFPAGKDPMDVNVNNSFTNINDIRSYVRTHLRSFKEPGGCALLLETIVRCHGVEYIENLKGNLLVCNCKESIKDVGSSNICTKTFADDCMTPQLLSLLLTGEARSSYQNWSGDTFGIGLLRMNNNDDTPNSQMLRPLKQIWLCQGDTGYSTLFLQKKNLIGKEDSLDQPGKGFQLAHWNCWSAELSTMNVISTLVEAKPISNTVSEDSEDEGKTVLDSISARIRKEHKRNLASSANGSYEESSPITAEELKSIKSYPDDEKYYPDQYRRWRFHFGSTGSDSVIPVDAWIPFYRLRGRQRMSIEMKFAPRIVALVRSRWPMATVRDFSPSGQYPIV